MPNKTSNTNVLITCFVCGFLLKGGLGSILVDFVLLATTIGSVHVVLRVIL
jgi:hypothetical protein